MDHESNAILQLPVSIVSPVDIGRLVREIDAVDNFLREAAIRQPGTKIKMPRTSRLMDELVLVNKLNILMEPDRVRLAEFLRSIKTEAPIMHFSFSADPSPIFTQKLMTWLRREIHPLVLIRVGLQPNIGAGCTLRTNNKYFDFSLRQHFKQSREILAQRLRGSIS